MRQILIPVPDEPGVFKCRVCGTTVKGSAAVHVSMSPWPHATLLVTVDRINDEDRGRSPWSWEPGTSPHKTPEGDLFTDGQLAGVI